MQKAAEVQTEALKMYDLDNTNGTKLRILNRGAAVFQRFVKDLHGDLFQHKFWTLEEQAEDSLVFSCFSKDGQEGYPEDLQGMVRYRLTDLDELVVDYTAISNKATPDNLTNHTCFNLNGIGGISDHQLLVDGEGILQVDEKLRPSGDFVTPGVHQKNFSSLKPVEKTQVDDVYVPKKEQQEPARSFATQTGIDLRISTNQPGMVVYIPKELPQLWEYKEPLPRFPSICLEAQHSKCPQSKEVSFIHINAREPVFKSQNI